MSHTFYVQFAPGTIPALLAQEQIDAAAADSDRGVKDISFIGVRFQYNGSTGQWYIYSNATIPQVPTNLAELLAAHPEVTVTEVMFTKGATPIDGRQAYQGTYLGVRRFKGCRAEVENRADKNCISQSLVVWGTLHGFVEFTNLIRQRRLRPTIWHEPRWWQRLISRFW